MTKKETNEPKEKHKELGFRSKEEFDAFNAEFARFATAIRDPEQEPERAESIRIAAELFKPESGSDQTRKQRIAREIMKTLTDMDTNDKTS